MLLFYKFSIHDFLLATLLIFDGSKGLDLRVGTMKYRSQKIYCALLHNPNKNFALVFLEFSKIIGGKLFSM